jgi:hypothetical protein
VSDEQFSADHGGDKPLGEVPQFVVVVALPVELFGEPIKGRDFGVGIVAANHEYYAVNQN